MTPTGSKRLSTLELADEVWRELSTWAKRGFKLSTVAGVFIAMMYFLRIRYVPIESLASLSAVGALIAGLSAAFFLAFVFLWALPTMLITGLSTTKYWPSLTDWFRAEDRGGYDWRRVAVFVLCTSGAGWGVLALYAWPAELAGSKEAGPQAMLAVLTAAALGLSWYILRQRGVASPVGPLRPPSPWAYAGRPLWIAALVISGLYPFFAVLQMLVMSPVTPQDSLTAIHLFTWIGMLVMVLLHGINLWIALDAHGKQVSLLWAGQLIVTITPFAALFVLLGMPTPVLDAVMRAASVRVPHANVALTKEACSALRLEGVETSGANAVTPDSGSSAACLLRDVLVLSRLGDRWRIACRPNGALENDARSFNISTSHVAGWVEVRPSKAASDRERDLCSPKP